MSALGLGNGFMCDCVSGFGNPEDICAGVKSESKFEEISLSTAIDAGKVPLICTDIYDAVCGECSETPEEGGGGMSDCTPDNPDSAYPCCYCIGSSESTTHEVQASPLTIVPTGTTHYSDEEITSACCSSIDGYLVCDDYTLSYPVYYVPLSRITQDKTAIALSGISITATYSYEYTDPCTLKKEKTKLDSANIISYPVLPFTDGRHTVYAARIPAGMWASQISLETLACIFYSDFASDFDGSSRKGITYFTERGGSCSVNLYEYDQGEYIYGVYDNYTRLFYPDCELSFFSGELDTDTGEITPNPNACIEFINIGNRGNTKYFLPADRSGVKIPFVPLYMNPSASGRICCPEKKSCGFLSSLKEPGYQVLSSTASCTAYYVSSISCDELKVASS